MVPIKDKRPIWQLIKTSDYRLYLADGITDHDMYEVTNWNDDMRDKVLRLLQNDEKRRLAAESNR